MSNIMNLCRLCTNKENVAFNFQFVDLDNVPVSDKIKIIAPEILACKRSLPQNICTTCNDQLNESYKFRNQCLQSQEILIRNLNELEIENNDDIGIQEPNDPLEMVNSEFLNQVSVAETNPKFENILLKHEPEDSLDFKPIFIKLENTITNLVSEDINTEDFVAVNVETETNLTNQNKSNKYVCQICEKTFSRNSSLKRHYNNTHSTSMEPVSYECKYCCKKFKKLVCFEQHVAKHTCGRRYLTNGQKFIKIKAKENNLQFENIVPETILNSDVKIIVQAENLTEISKEKTGKKIKSFNSTKCTLCGKMIKNAALTKHLYKIHQIVNKKPESPKNDTVESKSDTETSKTDLEYSEIDLENIKSDLESVNDLITSTIDTVAISSKIHLYNSETDIDYSKINLEHLKSDLESVDNSEILLTSEINLENSAAITTTSNIISECSKIIVEYCEISSENNFENAEVDNSKIDLTISTVQPSSKITKSVTEIDSECSKTDVEHSEISCESSKNDLDNAETDTSKMSLESSTVQARSKKTKKNGKGGECSKIELENLEIGVENYKLYVKNTKTESGTHKCKICEQIVSRSSALTRHLRTVHKMIVIPPYNSKYSEKSPKCQICEKYFSCSGAVIRHMRDVHKLKIDNPNAIEYDSDAPNCPICGKQFGYKNSLKRHFQQVHKIDFDKDDDDNTKESEAEKESEQEEIKNVESEKDLIKIAKEQLEKESNKVRNNYTCEFCGKSFANRSYLNQHFRMHSQSGIKPFQCEICGKTYADIRYLNAHKFNFNHGTIDPKYKRYVCETCGKTCFLKNNFRKHMRTHIKPLYYKCEKCNTRFKSEARLTAHVENGHKPIRKRDTTNNNYCCEICGKIFKSKDILRLHLYTHPEVKKPYKCDQCGKEFGQMRDLKRHTRMHTGERPYSCEICGNTFVDRTPLMYHIRTKHMDNSDKKCEICNKTFYRPTELKQHLLIHAGYRPHSCGICGKNFFHKQNLKRHIRRTHHAKEKKKKGIGSSDSIISIHRK